MSDEELSGSESFLEVPNKKMKFESEGGGDCSYQEDDMDFWDDDAETFALDLDKREGEADMNSHFLVLGPSEIVDYMADNIKRANGVLQLPPTTMRILLHHFKWNTEALFEAFYGGDQDKVFNDANIVNPAKLQDKTTAEPVDCGICYLPMDSFDMYGIQCGHQFCKRCWIEYLTTKIMEDGIGHKIQCAAHNCPILVDDTTVTELIMDPQVKMKYQHLITNSFVQCNKLMCWCPSAFCSNAIRWMDSLTDCRAVTCTCGFSFCFQCREEDHDPIKCDWLMKWKRKCVDDSETCNWLVIHTKNCPKCSAAIEKNGGCNHIVCKNVSCRAEFCWICLGAWEPHRGDAYHCNRFDEAETRSAQDTSRAALVRYLFYHERYMNHMQSLKFEHQLHEDVQVKMKEIQNSWNASWVEVQFLQKAVEILCLCRQTLMYTYPFAFYLSKTNDSAIFEDNQRDLESATETLSEYIERDITSENLADIKQKVQDKYRYCESRRQIMLDHVHEGYEKNLWVPNSALL